VFGLFDVFVYHTFKTKVSMYTVPRRYSILRV